MQMRSEKREDLTTGDVVKMLDGLITRSTVTRYYDNGILRGWKNPITGRRLIDPESVKALAKKSGIELSEGMEAWPQRGRSRKTISKPSSRSGPSSR